MISVFTAPAIVMIPVAGIIADRYGRRPIILFGLVCFGTGGVSIALTTDFRIVLGLRLIQGIGFAALGPVIITSIGDLYAGSKEVTAQGIRFTGSGLVQTAFPLAAGGLIMLTWQYPFLLQLVAFPISLAIDLSFEKPTESKIDDYDSVQEQFRDLWSLVSQRRAAAMVIARGIPVIVWIGFLTYNSILVVQVLGGTPAQAGMLAAVGSLSYATSVMQAGRLTAYFDNQLYLLVGMNVTLAAGMIAIFLATSIWIAFVAIVLMGVGFGVLLSIYRSIMTNLAPPSLRGGYVSLGEGFGRITATTTPIGMGAGIAIGIPIIGAKTSIRFVGMGSGVVAAAIGIVCLLVLSATPPVRYPFN